MPMRTRDGVVHAVLEYAERDFNGQLVCGDIYQRKDRRQTWAPEVRGRMTVIVKALPSSKTPNCLWCAVGASKRYPF